MMTLLVVLCINNNRQELIPLGLIVGFILDLLILTMVFGIPV